MPNEQGNQAQEQAPAEPTEKAPIETFDEGVSRLEGLLGPDEDDGTPSENENQQRTEEDVSKDNLDEEGSDDTEETSEDTDEEAESDTEDPEETAEDGEDPLQFAEDTVVVVEGKEVTLGDIITERTQERVKSFQADYTRKTQAAAERERTNDDQADKLLKYAENLKSQRDLFVEFQTQFTPQPPDISMVETDPIGYQQQKAYYDQWQETFNGFASQSQQMRAQEAQSLEMQKEQFLQQQRQKMVELVPELGTSQGVTQFREDISTWVTELSEDKVNNMADADMAPIIRDAIKYRKLEAKKPTAKKMLENKPRILKPKARKTLSQTSSKKANRNRLKNSGDLEDAVASLMDLDL